MVRVKPGGTAEILYEGEEGKLQSSAQPAMVYAAEGTRLILSQTAPPVPDARLGKRFLITFLEKRGGTTVRYGAWARLRKIGTYELSSSQQVPALAFEQETEPEACNLRMNFRIKPMLDKGLSAQVMGLSVTIVDISVGGVRISSKEAFPFKPHDVISLTISVDNTKLDVRGKVLRAWQARAAGRGALLSYASVQFLDNQVACECVLSRKIILMERELLARGMQ